MARERSPKQARKRMPQPHSWLPFKKARAFARELGLPSKKAWHAYSRGEFKKSKGLRPANVPGAPDQAYRFAWRGWGDWLGTGNVSMAGRPLRPFAEARAFARKLGLSSLESWRAYGRGEFKASKGLRPLDVPSAPNQAYRFAWRGWGDWLGTGNVSSRNRQYRPFEEARAFARSLKLVGRSEWLLYVRGKLPEKGGPPKDIPCAPWTSYKAKGWSGIWDFLGYEPVRGCRREYLSFEEARAFARELGLPSRKGWAAYLRGEFKKSKGLRPVNVPSAPQSVYRHAWLGWRDWLGTGNAGARYRQYRPFEEARAFARSLKLVGRSEWSLYVRGKLPEKGGPPKDIPCAPWTSYKAEGWSGIWDFLGYEPNQGCRREYLPFEDARAFVRSLKLESSTQWWPYSRGELRKKGKRPWNIPSAPWRVYKGKGWAGFSDWLGNGRRRRRASK